jgi:hypothetical protein
MHLYLSYLFVEVQFYEHYMEVYIERKLEVWLSESHNGFEG